MQTVSKSNAVGKKNFVRGQGEASLPSRSEKEKPPNVENLVGKAALARHPAVKTVSFYRFTVKW